MDSPLMDLLKEHGMEPTRENYLHAAFYGNPPSKLHPEEEDQVPAPLQDGFRELDKKLFDNKQKKAAKAAAAKAKAEQK